MLYTIIIYAFLSFRRKNKLKENKKKIGRRKQEEEEKDKFWLMHVPADRMSFNANNASNAVQSQCKLRSYGENGPSL